MDFSHIALLLVSAAVAGAVARLIKQPLLVGYLFAGVVLGFFGVAGDSHELETLGKVGVALLLFLVGLEMNIQELPSIGKIAFITGIGQILFTVTIGFALASILGFGSLSALYIAIALAFSSTIIIIKLLSERQELSSLHGKIAIGFLLVQDLVAVLILMFLAGLDRGDLGVNTFLSLGAKGALLLAAVWFLSRKILPKLFTNIFDTSVELVFVVSIAWALGVAALVGGPMGFSLEIGGFLAGLALSNLPEHLQVAARTRPLRDFFLTIFFLVLGTHLLVEDVASLIIPAIVLSLVVLVGNPLIVMTLMGLQGYKRRTGFMASVTVAQISEFSLIVVAMGVAVGHVDEQVAALIIIVAVVTMTVSTYMILGADKIFLRIKSHLSIFERKKVKEQTVFVQEENMDAHVVLVGCDRTGRVILPWLKKFKHQTVVVDFNPKIIAALISEGTPCIFGDINDAEVIEAARVGTAQLVISTNSDLQDNLLLLDFIRNLSRKPFTVFRANSMKDATTLYARGAGYVLLPEVVAGEHVRHLLKTSLGNKDAMLKLGKSHKKRLLSQKW